MRHALGKAFAAFLLVLAFLSCTNNSRSIVILSGSENETLEPIIESYARGARAEITMKYKGSVDIMLALQSGAEGFDAVWPAQSLWISLGDSARRVRHTRSIMTSPVVFGVREDLARTLGFVGRDVSVADILSAIRKGGLRFMMTSASQSNSGASAYLGFLYALRGNPDVLTMADLDDPRLQGDVRDLLAGIHRSSGSSGWLKDLFLKSDADAMVNYEALVIEANRELVATGRKPLRVIYPVDGMVMADSPLGFLGASGGPKEELFLGLQKHLLSEPVQKQIAALGRRTGIAGAMGTGDPRVFNPDWGIDLARVLSPVRMPAADVLARALELYQTELRKPSLTVFCLDFSGSMQGEGNRRLVEAMDLLLDPQKARPYMIQPGGDDLVHVIAFSDRILGSWQVRGGDAEGLAELRQRIRDLAPAGSTDIYSPALEGLRLIARTADLQRYVPAIVLMTDGESNVGRSLADLRRAWEQEGLDVPVFPLMFGEASEKQLSAIAGETRGRVFDARKDLVQAFRSVKGYN